MTATISNDVSHVAAGKHQASTPEDKKLPTDIAAPPLKRVALIAIAGLIILAVGIGIGIELPKEWWSQPEVKADDASHQPAAPAGEKKSDEPETVKVSPESARKYDIRVGTAKKVKLVSTIVAPARVSYNSEATAVIGSPVLGRVVDIKGHVGDAVEKGDELLVIESTELGEAQSDFLQKRTAAATAKLAIGPSTSIYTRAKKLYDESQGIGLTDLQKREVELRQAEGELANAEAASTAAENKLRLLGMDAAATDTLIRYGKVDPRYVVKSPLKGQITERSVNLGELVKPDREKLFVVADASTLWVWADVPESRAREVTEKAEVEINATAISDRSFAGKVSHISSSVDPQTHSLRVRIEVKGDAALKPGMFARVEIGGNAEGENAEPTLAVPDSAIQSVNGSTAVFIPVKGEENTFQVRLVSVGVLVDGMTSIISGLEAGERIVTGGSAILKADLLKASAKDDD